MKIEYLAPYLPYKINVVWLNEIEELVFDPNPANGVLMELTPENIVYFSTNNKTTKPALMPLSKLSNDQWFEVFIAGMGGLKAHYDSFCSYRVESTRKVSYLFNTKERDLPNFPKKYKTLFYFNYGMPQFVCDFSGAAFNQLAAFNKLYELHADVAGLIENGFAFDLTLLKTQ